MKKGEHSFACSCKRMINKSFQVCVITQTDCMNAMGSHTQ